MVVELRPFGSQNGQNGSFLGDIWLASRTHPPSRYALRDLWLVYLLDLSTKSPIQLGNYLAQRQPWRTHGNWQVYKTPDAPCVAYTTLIQPTGEVWLIALGACHAYPGNDANLWWTSVLVPRLHEL